MDESPFDLFGFLEVAREQIAVGSLPWVLASWAIITALAAVAVWIVNLGFRRLHNYIASLQGTRITAIRARGQDLLTEQEVTLIVLGLLRFVRLASYLLLLYVYLTFGLGLFPATRDIATSLFGYFTHAAVTIGTSAIDYLPSLAFLAVLIWVTGALIKLMKLAFDRIAYGRVRLANFPAEFAQPTFRLSRALVIVFAVIVAYPYLPGSGSPAFQAVSIFIGLLVSMGSSGAIANIVSGLSLTYMRAFKIGDRVKISDTEGDVIDRTTFVTKIRTPKNVEVTVPNAMVMSNHIVNYSGQDAEPYLALHTTLTLGYDVDWRRVHEIMTSTALATEGILEDPAPFVLQTSLDDFYVHYELNAHTRTPRNMARTYSSLHAGLQDAFRDAGIEIASPHLTAYRDGTPPPMAQPA